MFPYYGGKGRLAPWIASLIPEHRVYVEPFAGSAAVLLAKSPSTHEILNDVDGNIVTFFRVLRDRPDELERLCALSPYARDEFAACELDDAGELDELERARRFWVRSSQSFASTATSATGWSSSITRGSNNARSAANRCGRFQGVAERLRNVTIENRHVLEVLARYDCPDAVCYLDPPYVGDARSAYRDGRRPGGDYAHEFESEADHRALAAAAAEYSGTVLISGYPSALYEELYGGWSAVQRSVVRRTSTSRGSKAPAAIEVVWCNRPVADQLVFGPAVGAL